MVPSHVADVPSAVNELLESVEEHLRTRREELVRSADLLLQSVEARLETRGELRRLRGENFNVFRLLDMEGNEDELHSRFIAELLDPHGSHDSGTKFLQLFLNQIGEQVDQAFGINAERATVKREKVIGPIVIDGERSTGGRIDIFVSDGEHHLSIENKIWSEEGEKQVTRYCNYLSDANVRNFVLFLTLHGEEADTEKENYKPISYREHVLPWLRSCQQHATDFPILRETIKQYIITVERLTGGFVMDRQIRDAMRQHYRAAWEIRWAFDEPVKGEVADLVPEVRTELSAQAEQREWDVQRAGRSPGLRIEHKQKSWGDTQVRWEYDWLGIRRRPRGLGRRPSRLRGVSLARSEGRKRAVLGLRSEGKVQERGRT